MGKIFCNERQVRTISTIVVTKSTAKYHTVEIRINARQDASNGELELAFARCVRIGQLVNAVDIAVADEDCPHARLQVTSATPSSSSSSSFKRPISGAVATNVYTNAPSLPLAGRKTRPSR